MIDRHIVIMSVCLLLLIVKPIINIACCSPFSLSNIGLPFYGRSFAGSGLTKFGQANDGTADNKTWKDDEGSPQCEYC